MRRDGETRVGFGYTLKNMACEVKRKSSVSERTLREMQKHANNNNYSDKIIYPNAIRRHEYKNFRTSFHKHVKNIIKV